MDHFVGKEFERDVIEPIKEWFYKEKPDFEPKNIKISQANIETEHTDNELLVGDKIISEDTTNEHQPKDENDLEAMLLSAASDSNDLFFAR